MTVTVQGVSFAYAAHPVLEGVDLVVGEGEILAIVGPNGAGKTTLLKTIAGALRPQKGLVYLDFREAHHFPARERAKLLAMVEQGMAPGFDFTVRELVELGRIPHLGRLDRLGPEDREAVERALAWAGLTELAHRRWSELSGGERQRALLAMAFAQEPKLLLLDEPTAHLDVAHQIGLMQLISSWAKQGLTVIMALHDLNLAAAFSHRLVLLQRGRIRACGPPHAVLTPTNLREVFGEEAVVRVNPYTGQIYVHFFRPPQPKRKLGQILVIGGGGGVEDLLPILASEYAVTLGVISPLDSEYRIAQALGIPVIAEAPFSPVSSAACAEFCHALEGAQAVVVGPTWFGWGNLILLEILVERARAKPILVVDADSFPERDFTGGQATTLIRTLLACGAKPVRKEELLRALSALWGQNRAEPNQGHDQAQPS